MSGFAIRSDRKSAAAIASASTGSIASAVAERGSASIAESSPSRSPGPRKASTISLPSPAIVDTFTRPLRRITTESEVPSW